MALLSNGLFIALAGIALFALGYRFYSRFLAERVLGLDPNRPTPSRLKQDGIDYVPTRKPILFGHHFASIAGLGPIVGPAVAVYWGWLPAVLWVIFGAILIGAVHDMMALGCSLRHEGRGIGDLTVSVVGRRARFLFLLIIFFMLALAMGLFAYIIAIVFVNLHPEAVIPVVSLIFIAVLIGLGVYRWKVRLATATVVGFVAMMAFVWVGLQHPVPIFQYFISDQAKGAIEQGLSSNALAATKIQALEQDMLNANLPGDVAKYLSAQGHADLAGEVRHAAGQARTVWIYVLLFYAWLASILPVWLLLQPRDYLNSYQLYLGLAAIVVGLVGYAIISEGHARIVAPAINRAALSDSAAPYWLPFLFITVACGACSGFHNLVSSGTTVRQISSERDVRPIAYGAMIVEGVLALLVILACTVPFANLAAWHEPYASWSHINAGIGPKLDAFIFGAGSFISSLGIGKSLAVVFMSVVVVSFAMTTLDSATRLLRYNIEEIGKSVGIAVEGRSKAGMWTVRVVAALLAVAAIGFFALLKIPTGGVDAAGHAVMKPAGIVLLLLFGTSNQLLAGFGLLIVSIWLFKSGRLHWVTFFPMVFMLTMTIYAMILQLNGFWGAQPRQWTPLVTCGIILLLAGWLIIEAVIVYVGGGGKRTRAPAMVPAGEAG